MRPFLCALSSLPAFGPAAGIVAGTSRIGTAERVENRATARSADMIRKLARGSGVYFDEFLQTGEAARLELALNDGSTISMGQRAGLTLDRFVPNPALPGVSLGLRLAGGAMLFTSGAIDGPEEGHIRIRTSFAAVAARGATLWAGPTGDADGVLVISGEARISNAGRVITLRPGEGTSLRSPASPPSAPIVWPQAKVEHALAAVAFRG